MKDHLILQGVKLILQGLEVDANDQNYIKTPWRVLDTYKELFNHSTPFPPTFTDGYTEMLVARHHTAWGMCPHHLLPVHLDISIGYIPNGAVVGLSKLARIANHAIGKPILQEAVTQDITRSLMSKIHPTPKGAGCVIEGVHMCMQMRGVKTPGNVVTSSMEGVFLTEPATRAEFLSLVRASGK
jgi:GTP cyclohydrolase IA